MFHPTLPLSENQVVPLPLSPYSSFVLFFPMRREPILDNGPYTMGNSVSTDMFGSGGFASKPASKRFSTDE